MKQPNQPNLHLPGERHVRPWHPAQRLMEKPVSYLSDAELLEILLSHHMPDDQAMTAARSLLKEYGSLHALADLSPGELAGSNNMSVACAQAVVSSLALGSRAASPPARPGGRLLSADLVARQFKDVFAGSHQEEFHALLLDTKLRLIKDSLITVGLVDRTNIHPREVFREAIRFASSSLILMHNHPSGDPTPSRQDIEATNTLTEAGKIIGIQVVDHVIIGTPSPSFPQGYLSLREEKLIKAA